MSKTFLGIGECMVEFSPEADGSWRQGFAGDVFNSLWYARACLPDEDTVALHTGLGSDAISADFEEFLAGHGIELGESPRFADRTLGLYLIHLHRGERSFSYWRDTSAARRLASDAALLARRVATADLVYLSGITLAILPADDLESLLDVLATRAAGTLVAFDPNIRPRLWRSIDAMRDGIARASASADIVMPGVEDEALCFGAATAEAVADRYLTNGARQVVVKDGGRHVIVRGDTTLDLTLESIAEPVDTTGAGDSFAGVYLAGVMSGLDTEASLRRAHAFAAQVIMSRGALCPHADLPRP